MCGYSVTFVLDIEYADGECDTNTFTNMENAVDCMDECFYDADKNNPIEWYKITKTETSGGMIVDQEVIEEWSYYSL